ncbi:AAA domain-containing protein [Frateuria aurantia]|uniref:PLD phosphodiesterase domain-containing protein n=1 Tax=Frateuria aurantia (strain ATCC 33424 / DSM 6220 / KCTC 2777 / LMG 1558 / NBRC 3245 / NCIMB 13370) TaxID=767434 RepID=H8L103_FRAAD|nr:AAA domain-containing protein [Frateuria aurantia]AFC86323.1 hypothetical protein Fraau_1932 [Frateuria aurantia DSM 6220]
MMNEHSLKLAGYWRNSLADADNDRGALSRPQAEKLARLPAEAIRQGQLEADMVRRLFEREPDSLSSVNLSLRPWIYPARSEHGQTRTGRPAIITPVVCRVTASRDGRLYPSARAMVPRDLLEPLEHDSFSIGRQEAMDHFLSNHATPAFAAPAAGSTVDPEQHRQQWSDYLDFCQQMLRTVSQNWPPEDDGYDLADYGYIFKQDQAEGFNRHIINLYDHLRAGPREAPLFDRYAQQAQTPDEPCLAPNSQFANRLAHASDRFALAPAQRDALSHLLVAGHGDILAVNGPPGTGKTTLLLSAVATLWAKAALQGDEPPVIVASSTNNQAVTNIITAFGKDFARGDGPLAGRWLPEVHSFGAYFPKTSAEAEMTRSYQTRSFFSRLESQEYLDTALPAYMAKARATWADAPPRELATVLQRLQEAIGARQQHLAAIEQAWVQLGYVRHAIESQLGPDPQAGIDRLETVLDLRAGDLAAARSRQQTFRHHLAHEPLLYRLLSWLPPVADKRLRLARLQFDVDQPGLQAADSLEAMEAALAGAVTKAEAAHHSALTRLEQARQWLLQRQERLTRWGQAIAVLPQSTDHRPEEVSLDDCDHWADTTLRFEIFLLTSHYWEGRWLQEVSENLTDIVNSRSKNGRKTLEKNWRRWMKLAPCVVATLFRLPGELGCKRHNGHGFVDDYALDFADLLIVDEAGQVLPEVAGASFALARQALVIGDTQQIEPIWSIPPAIDIGNLVAAGLRPTSGDPEVWYERFGQSGRSAASGSVMAIAQSVSRYRYDPELARGMYLYEHRRCYDDIIDYCNALCYKGRLLPRRGPAPDEGLPPLAYVHVDGCCETGTHGSRRNRLEAQAIAAWLQANAAQLLARYKLPLHEIVGVITPFGAQTQAIEQAFTATGISAGKAPGQLTVGTVHAFQGGERPVIIFSAVYSKHADGGFIDRNNSMLNVAVSRAKDSFIVFGDMDLFSAMPASTPRGMLMEHLAAVPGSELDFEVPARQDLQTTRTGLSHLHEAAEHDDFLRRVLQEARREIQIVTPWMRLQWIRHDHGLEYMADAVARGVQLQIYTDRYLNRGVSRNHPEGDPAAVEAFHQAIEALEACQIEVCQVGKVHSKLLMADDDLLCVGSFNWLSAQRAGDHVRHETSMVYRGPDVGPELTVNRHSLQQRLVQVSA